MEKFRNENKLTVEKNADTDSFDEDIESNVKNNGMLLAESNSSYSNNSNGSSTSENYPSIDFAPFDNSFPMDAATVMRTSIKKESLTDKNPSKKIYLLAHVSTHIYDMSIELKIQRF